MLISFGATKGILENISFKRDIGLTGLRPTDAADSTEDICDQNMAF